MDKIIDMFYILYILVKTYTLQAVAGVIAFTIIDIIIYKIFGNSIIKQLIKLYYNNI